MRIPSAPPPVVCDQEQVELLLSVELAASKARGVMIMTTVALSEMAGPFRVPVMLAVPAVVLEISVRV